MTAAQYVVRAIDPNTGAYIYSRTNNPQQRIRRLKYNIASVNGRGTAVFDRFEPFVGCDENTVKFEVYKLFKV